MTYWVTLCTGADYGSPAIALADQPDQCLTVSYTHLTLPTNREV